MTIFDKLSGFAHKAKENATARAILAKDKRLENSLSEKLDPAHIGLLKVYLTILEHKHLRRLTAIWIRWPRMDFQVRYLA